MAKYGKKAQSTVKKAMPLKEESSVSVKARKSNESKTSDCDCLSEATKKRSKGSKKEKFKIKMMEQLLQSSKKSKLLME